jgi:hypothetical protein
MKTDLMKEGLIYFAILLTVGLVAWLVSNSKKLKINLNPIRFKVLSLNDSIYI